MTIKHEYKDCTMVYSKTPIMTVSYHWTVKNEQGDIIALAETRQEACNEIDDYIRELISY